MALTYGFIRSRVASKPRLQPSKHGSETQYHVHVSVTFAGADQPWDCAINVGTDDADDLLLYRIVNDYQHPIVQQLRAAPAGFTDLTGTAALPALDFLRSDVLTNTGSWSETGVMDGSETPEPIPSLEAMLDSALTANADVYIFGREYSEGYGIHDVHMNQGSTGSFINHGNDGNDHNDIRQDGAVIVDFGDGKVAGYFTAFTQQLVPTDDLGNPVPGAHEITDADVGSAQPG